MQDCCSAAAGVAPNNNDQPLDRVKERKLRTAAFYCLFQADLDYQPRLLKPV